MYKVRVLFVCLGNICRSPTAQGVFQKMVDDSGLSADIFVDSAGTSSWHIGEPPDKRSSAAALKAGYDLSAQRGRQAVRRDFDNFDYILAMDKANLSELQNLCPAKYKGHLGLFLPFAWDLAYTEVPDPYHGNGEGFKVVLSLVEAASAALLTHIKINDLQLNA